MRRREFLKLLATATTVAAATPIIAACSSSSSSSSPDSSEAMTSTTAEAARDTLRIAAIGGPGENININEATSTATWIALYAVFESLVIAGDQKPTLQLASSVEPNENATAWTIKLREGATFSDGTPVTASDVLASFQHVIDSPFHGTVYADVDLAASKAVDDSTVEVVLSRPRADFIESVLGLNSMVYKSGDPSLGIGSGPYVVASGDSGQGWKLKANEYFPAEKRVSDSLEIQVIADAQARLRAVDSGAVDLAMDLPATAKRSLRNAEVWSPGATDSKALMFILNTKVAPFDDVEVRRAMKMALDRDALIAAALDGTGTPGTDVPGLGFADYPSDLKKVQMDQEAARKIFQDKGITQLTLVTSDFTPGMNDGADVAARQLKDLGVEVQVDKRDPTTYYSDIEALKKLPFFATYIVNRPLTSALPYLSGSKAVFNLSGFGTDGDWDKRLEELQAEADADARAALLADVARTMQEEGGELLWAYANEIHGRVAGVPDLTVSQSVPVVMVQSSAGK